MAIAYSRQDMRICGFDFIEGLPRSNGYDTILVVEVVDQLSKCDHSWHCTTPLWPIFSAMFAKEIVRFH